DLFRLGADQRRDLRARGLDRFAGRLAPRVHRRGVAERGAEVGLHGRQHFARHARGRRVIGVDLALHDGAPAWARIDTRWASAPAMRRSAFACSLSGRPTTTGWPESPPSRTSGWSGIAPRKWSPIASARSSGEPLLKIAWRLLQLGHTK